MNISCHLQSIPLSAIDLDDNTFSLSLWDETPSEILYTSIKKFGILHPPVLFCREDNKYRIVSGNKRIAIARGLSSKGKIFCHVISNNTSKKVVYSYLIEDAVNSKPLSITEQIILFEKLLKSELPAEALPLLKQLGLEPKEHVLENLLKLRSLSLPALKALHQGNLSEKNARKLLNLAEADQIRIIELTTDFRLGGSKQRKLIELSKELIMRENTSLERILSEFPLTNETEQPCNVPQKSSALISWLQNRCFPQSTKAEKDFNKQVSNFNLPSNMEVKHTPSFEDKKVILFLRFPDLQSLGNVMERIKKLLK